MKEKQQARKPQHIISAEAKEAMYTKYVEWSEKDKKNADLLRKVIEDSYLSRQRGNELINWLYSLELRIQSH